MKIDFDGIQAFVTVAELGAFNKAADKLNITQAALTRRIQKLESYLGLRLIHRTTRQMALTTLGKELLPKARTWVHDLTTTLTELKDTSRASKGNFTLACVPTMAAYILPDLIQQYAKEYPGNRIKLIDASAYEIREAILDQKAEIGLSVQGPKHPDLEECLLFQDPLMFYCRDTHALSRRQSVTWSDMNLNDLVVVSSFMATRIFMDYQLAKRGIRLQGTTRCNTMRRPSTWSQQGWVAPFSPPLHAQMESAKGWYGSLWCPRSSSAKLCSSKKRGPACPRQRRLFAKF